MSTLLSIIALLTCGYLPGAVVFRLPVLERERRAGLDAEERVFWAVVLSVAWSSAVVLVLAAFHAYTFARLLAADGLLVAGLVAACRGRLRLAGQRRRTTATAWIPLVAIGLAAWLFFPPFEHVLGGKDPGVYVNEGISLAQQGGLVLRDPVVASLPPALRDLFYPSHHVAEYYGVRFMGFHILDPAQGTVVGQFPHLLPAWIAVGYALGGLRGALATIPVAAMLGVLAVYFAGARLLGKGGAFLAAVVLTINVVTIWFAREPNSEVVAQALLFSALLAFGRSQVDGDRFFAPVAAVLYGLLLFLRLDMLVALACVVGVAVLQLFDRRRLRLSFVLPVAAIACLAWFYVTDVTKPYAMRFVAFAHTLGTSRLLGVAALGALFVAGAAVAARHARTAGAVRRLVPAVLVVTLVAAAAYAYFLRIPVHGKLQYGDARSLEIFTWYFPPVALLAALGGVAWVSWRDFWRAPVLLITSAAYCLFLFYKLQIVHEHFWAARRYVPIILPFASLMFAAAIVALVSWRRTWLKAAGTAVAALLVVLVATSSVRAARPVTGHVEYLGAVAHLDTLSRRFTKDDLVVFESRDTGSDLHVLALPLAYSWQQPVLVLSNPMPDKRLFRQFLEYAQSRYRNVYFLGGGGTDLVSGAIRSVPVMSDRFQLPEYESLKNEYPRQVRTKEFDFGVYRMTAGESAAATFVLDIGIMDDMNVVRFHAKERMGDIPFRWSRRSSYVALPRLTDMKELTLWLHNGGRPATLAPAHVTVSIDGKVVGSADPTPEFRPYSFTIPADAKPAISDPDRAVLVQLVTNTWSPRQVGAADDRDLGVMVKRIEIR